MGMRKTGSEADLQNDSTVPPTVAVIGCGPGGMSFLHTIATKRKQLKESGDMRGLMKLPEVTVFEKAADPGGVWRTNRKNDGMDGDDDSPNMYDGLWINASKESFEYYDYTFKAHFKEPQPTYLPRKQVLEYIRARVTQHEDIFQHVNFRTEVESLTYDETMKKFVIQSKNDLGEKRVQHFDKCVWAAGLNSKPKMIPEVLNKLADFKGQIVHAAQMDKLGSGNENAVKGKNILMVGDSYSAEDLALQCIKLGAEEITILSRNCMGVAVEMGSWPEDKVKVAYFSEVKGVKKDGTGKTILLKSSKPERFDQDDIEDVSIVIFCTGYEESTSFLPDYLNPFIYEDMWTLSELGLDLKTWKMKNNCYSEILGHVQPSKWLEMSADIIYEKVHRKLLISNPNMMILHEMSGLPLLEIDVNSWLILAYITGERKAPTTEELEADHMQELLMLMDDHCNRLEMDENYKKAYKSSYSLFENHWVWDVTSEAYSKHLFELNSLPLRLLARDMKDANYPLQIGDIDKLNEVGLAMLEMENFGDVCRAILEDEDENTQRWKTFRDYDPSICRSIFTGQSAIPLKGKWLEIDDEGNLPGGKNL